MRKICLSTGIRTPDRPALKNEEGGRKSSVRKRAIAKYVNAVHLDTKDECRGSYILPLALGSSE
jgi:hypothetical protein